MYDPKPIESKWQKKWKDAKIFEIDLASAKNPYYTHVMFPYPSGAALHVGHWYQYGPTDSFVRFKRMQGNDVYFPMGYDSFGLPAENYAIKTGTPPVESIKENTTTMTQQFERMGCMYDWSKTVTTSDPVYYKWTQWLFLQMYKNDLAYKKEANVNFCPQCQTVLANEQAQDGTCERCSTEVIQKSLAQWFWKITKYADQLLDGLEDLDWPQKTKAMQRHWIGKSEGAEIRFQTSDSRHQIEVFTTRPDTLFGVTYMVLAPEHPLVDAITTEEKRHEVQKYREDVQKKTELERIALEKEKSGVFTGGYAINPANGEEIPIWIADYVLMGYGTGAVMAVPGHDERDWEFAKKYDLLIKEVVQGGELSKAAFTEEGIAVYSDFLDGLSTPDAKERMIKWVEEEKKGSRKIQYRLHDWLISRQRYWGAPIPIVYDPEGKAHPIPEEHLPWELPTDVEFKPTGESPLKGSKELQERTEKLFGKGWTPEYDTMDTFVCSSFYYLMFLSTEGYGMCSPLTANRSPLIDPQIEHKWMPLTCYMGGPEHACGHLIFARFVMMALHDFGIVSHKEPFKKLVHQGLITNKGAKMSKSKGNVVSPDEFVEKYGSDVFRMYLMFMGPYTDGGDWSDTGIKGIERFAQRAWKAVSSERLAVSGDVQDDSNLVSVLHRTIKRVTEDLEGFHFNTAISALMELLNMIEKVEELSLDSARTFTLLLAPLSPHLAEELWEIAGGEGMVIEQKWPSYDENLLISDTVTIAVQVNGKVRGDFEVDTNASQEDVIAKAKELQNVAKFLEGKEPKKEIYVEGKLVSFVV